MTPTQKQFAQTLTDELVTHKIHGKIIGATTGPRVTTYKFEPTMGARLSTISKKFATIKMLEFVRVTNIPCTQYLALEVANISTPDIPLQPLLKTKKFTESAKKLPIALGVTTDGKPFYSDLYKMPHLLIGGRTGCGKTQLIYSIISSLITRNSPAKCKLLILDPKGTDYGNFSHLPHLMQPIVTSDPNAAISALTSATKMIETRFAQLSTLGTSTIDAYNKKTKDTPMPHVVIIVDELADLMATSRTKTTNALTKLLQRGRAAGVHVILATGRISGDTLPGALRANIPTRIAFQTRNGTESKCILGEDGAEILLSHGDILFSDAGRVPIRIHTPYISATELKQIL